MSSSRKSSLIGLSSLIWSFLSIAQGKLSSQIDHNNLKPIRQRICIFANHILGHINISLWWNPEVLDHLKQKKYKVTCNLKMVKVQIPANWVFMRFNNLQQSLASWKRGHVKRHHTSISTEELIWRMSLHKHILHSLVTVEEVLGGMKNRHLVMSVISGYSTLQVLLLTATCVSHSSFCQCNDWGWLNHWRYNTIKSCVYGSTASHNMVMIVSAIVRRQHWYSKQTSDREADSIVLVRHTGISFSF